LGPAIFTELLIPADPGRGNQEISQVAGDGEVRLSQALESIFHRQQRHVTQGKECELVRPPF
jgi:hypothetical protein